MRWTRSKGSKLGVSVASATWGSVDLSDLIGGTIGTLHVGGGLRAARFAPASDVRARGTVILVQGRAEFMELYEEAIADLVRRGYGVVAFDFRGQGGSRRVSRPGNHVGSFNEYVEDLCAVVRFAAQSELPRPFHILAHSMGGLVALLAIRTLANEVDRMVLLAPLLEIEDIEVPTTVAGPLTSLAAVAGLSKLSVGSSRAERRPFETNRITSDRARYDRLCALVDQNPELATGAPTIGWVRASLKAMRTAKQMAGRPLGVPALFVASGIDEIVSTTAIERFAQATPGCGLVMMRSARHQLLFERDEYRDLFFRAFEAFVGEPPAKGTVPERKVSASQRVRFEPKKVGPSITAGAAAAAAAEVSPSQAPSPKASASPAPEPSAGTDAPPSLGAPAERTGSPGGQEVREPAITAAGADVPADGRGTATEPSVGEPDPPIAQDAPAAEERDEPERTLEEELGVRRWPSSTLQPDLDRQRAGSARAERGASPRAAPRPEPTARPESPPKPEAGRKPEAAPPSSARQDAPPAPGAAAMSSAERVAQVGSRLRARLAQQTGKAAHAMQEPPSSTPRAGTLEGGPASPSTRSLRSDPDGPTVHARSGDLTSVVPSASGPERHKGVADDASPKAPTPNRPTADLSGAAPGAAHGGPMVSGRLRERLAKRRSEQAQDAQQGSDEVGGDGEARVPDAQGKTAVQGSGGLHGAATGTGAGAGGERPAGGQPEDRAAPLGVGKAPVSQEPVHSGTGQGRGNGLQQKREQAAKVEGQAGDGAAPSIPPGPTPTESSLQPPPLSAGIETNAATPGAMYGAASTTSAAESGVRVLSMRRSSRRANSDPWRSGSQSSASNPASSLNVQERSPDHPTARPANASSSAPLRSADAGSAGATGASAATPRGRGREPGADGSAATPRSPQATAGAGDDGRFLASADAGSARAAGRSVASPQDRDAGPGPGGGSAATPPTPRASDHTAGATPGAAGAGSGRPRGEPSAPPHDRVPGPEADRSAATSQHGQPSGDPKSATTASGPARLGSASAAGPSDGAATASGSAPGAGSAPAAGPAAATGSTSAPAPSGARKDAAPGASADPSTASRSPSASQPASRGSGSSVMPESRGRRGEAPRPDDASPTPADRDVLDRQPAAVRTQTPSEAERPARAARPGLRLGDSGETDDGPSSTPTPAPRAAVPSTERAEAGPGRDGPSPTPTPATRPAAPSTERAETGAGRDGPSFAPTPATRPAAPSTERTEAGAGGDGPSSTPTPVPRAAVPSTERAEAGAGRDGPSSTPTPAPRAAVPSAERAEAGPGRDGPSPTPTPAPRAAVPSTERTETGAGRDGPSSTPTPLPRTAVPSTERAEAGPGRDGPTPALRAAAPSPPEAPPVEGLDRDRTTQVGGYTAFLSEPHVRWGAELSNAGLSGGGLPEGLGASELEWLMPESLPMAADGDPELAPRPDLDEVEARLQAAPAPPERPIRPQSATAPPGDPWSGGPAPREPSPTHPGAPYSPPGTHEAPAPAASRQMRIGAGAITPKPRPIRKSGGRSRSQGKRR